MPYMVNHNIRKKIVDKVAYLKYNIAFNRKYQKYIDEDFDDGVKPQEPKMCLDRASVYTIPREIYDFLHDKKLQKSLKFPHRYRFKFRINFLNKSIKRTMLDDQEIENTDELGSLLDWVEIAYHKAPMFNYECVYIHVNCNPYSQNYSRIVLNNKSLDPQIHGPSYRNAYPNFKKMLDDIYEWSKLTIYTVSQSYGGNKSISDDVIIANNNVDYDKLLDTMDCYWDNDLFKKDLVRRQIIDKDTKLTCRVIYENRDRIYEIKKKRYNWTAKTRFEMAIDDIINTMKDANTYHNHILSNFYYFYLEKYKSARAQKYFFMH